MKKITLYFFTAFILLCSTVFAQNNFDRHPDTYGDGWAAIFNKDLSNAIYPKDVWSITDGIITATKDDALWSEKEYTDFILDLEFKNAPGTNSGIILRATEMEEWIPHSIEIQIADDYAEQWAKAEPNWQCAAVFGHQPAAKRTVKPAGEWNHYTITCKGQKIWIVLNGELVNECDMSKFTSATVNPDGTKIPTWLSNPMASLPQHGRIGFQGKHAGAPIYFRNIRIKEIK